LIADLEKSRRNRGYIASAKALLRSMEESQALRMARVERLRALA
jgi:hypothetical protein